MYRLSELVLVLILHPNFVLDCEDMRQMLDALLRQR